MNVACCVNSAIKDVLGDVSQKLNLNMQRRVWMPPERDQLKIKFDGAFSTEDRKAACGFIIRKQVGEAVLAGAANISPALDALSAESAACLFALEAAERALWHIQDRAGDRFKSTAGGDQLDYSGPRF